MQNIFDIFARLWRRIKLIPGWVKRSVGAVGVLITIHQIWRFVINKDNVTWVIAWSNHPLFPWGGFTVLITISAWLIHREAEKTRKAEQIRLASEKHANGATNKIIDERLAKYDRKWELLFAHLALEGEQMRQRERLDHFKENLERVVTKYSDYQAKPDFKSRLKERDYFKKRNEDLTALRLNRADQFGSHAPTREIDSNIERANISQDYDPPGYRVVRSRDPEIAEAYRTCYAKLSKQIEVLEHADRLATSEITQASKELFGATLKR